MNAARLSLAVCLVFAPPFAHAADINNTDIDVPVWKARLAETERLCAIDPASGECALAALSVQSDLARALAVVSYADDRSRIRPLVRRVLDLNPPGLQTAAAYALARLGPEASDTPRLVILLNDPVPTVRRAAWGALKASSDPAAREWVERAKFQANGERFIDDRRPIDAAALGVEPPPGIQPIWFEMAAWNDGAQLFTADGTPEDVLAHFEKLAGSPVRPLAEVQAWFPNDAAATKALARYANTAWFENVRVVALSDGTGANAGKPVRLAIVWRDVQFGKTGFALQWVPGSELESALGRPWAGESWPSSLPDSGKADIAANAAPFDKPGAERLDTELYTAVFMADGTGAETYLAMFPSGAYRAEVEALRKRPSLRLADAELAEPSEVKIRFSNMPTDTVVRFDLVPQRDLMDADEPYSPQPSTPVIAPAGQAAGEVIWKPDAPLAAGIYEIRAFFGQPEMEWDALSRRHALSADDAVVFFAVRILPRIVPIALTKTEYAPKEPVEIAYTDMPEPGSPNVVTPFFTIVKAGAPPGEWQQYVYVREPGAGRTTLDAPSTPGAYEVRVLFQEDAIVHGVAPLTVLDTPAAAPAATPAPPAAPDAAPTPTPTPPEDDPNVTVTLSKTSFAPNEPIAGYVTGLSGDERDWVAIVPAGQGDGSPGNDWVYVGGGTEADFTLRGQPAGSYEVRVRFKDEWHPVHGRVAVEIK